MRRFTCKATAEIRKQVEMMLRAGVIEACHSPVASSAVRVPPVLQPVIEGGAQDVETQEDHDRLDNDLRTQPAIPEFSTVVFSLRRQSAP